MKKILIGLVATVVILVVALVALNKQLKNPQQDASVTEKQDTEQDRLPALSALTGQNKEAGHADLMPLPKKTEEESKPESDTIVSIDGETCEKLPPLDNYVLLPVSKPKNDAAKAQEQSAQGSPARADEAGRTKSPASEGNAGAASPAPLAQAAENAAPSAESTPAPAAGIAGSSRQELTDMLAAKQSEKTQQPGTLPGQSSAAQASLAEESSGTKVTAPVSLPPKGPEPAAEASPADKAGKPDMNAGKAAEQAGRAETSAEPAAPVSLPKKDTAPAVQSRPGKAETRADSKAKDAKAGQDDSAGKAGKSQPKQKQEQGTAKGAQPKIVIFSRENGATVRITMDRKIPYKQMILTNPDRLVIDIAGEYKNMQSPAFPENDFVSGIRIGHYDNRTRLVFDLKETPARHHINQSGDQKRLDVRLDK